MKAETTKESAAAQAGASEQALSGGGTGTLQEAIPLEGAAAFFYEYGGYCWNESRGETREEGRRRCAIASAEAEAKASRLGYSFRWELDGGSSRDWDGEGPETPTWQCTAYGPDGDPVAALAGCDFGDSEPWGKPYRRVVEAELMGDVLE